MSGFLPISREEPPYVKDFKTGVKQIPDGKSIEYYKFHVDPDFDKWVTVLKRPPNTIEIYSRLKNNEKISHTYTYSNLDKELWIYVSHFIYDYDYKVATQMPVFKPGSTDLRLLDDSKIEITVLDNTKDTYPHSKIKLSYMDTHEVYRTMVNFRIRHCITLFIRKLLNAYKLNFHKIENLEQTLNVTIFQNKYEIKYEKKEPYAMIQFSLTRKEEPKTSYSFIIKGMYPRNYLITISANDVHVSRDRMGPRANLMDLCESLVKELDLKLKGKSQSNKALYNKVTEELKTIHDKMVLMLCHSKQITPSMPHPKQRLWEPILKENKIDNPGYHTVDSVQKSDLFKPTYVLKEKGALDPNIKDLIKERYDVVILPDCGGPWDELFKKENKDDQLSALVNIFNGVYGLLKPSGFLLVSKVFPQMGFDVKPKFTTNEFDSYVKGKGYLVDYYNQNTESDTPSKSSNLNSIKPTLYSSMIKLTKLPAIPLSRDLPLSVSKGPSFNKKNSVAAPPKTNNKPAPSSAS